MNFAQPLGTQHASKIYTSSAFKSITVLHSADYIIFVYDKSTLNLKIELKDKSQQIAGFFSFIPSDNKDKRIQLLYNSLYV